MYVMLARRHYLVDACRIGYVGILLWIVKIIQKYIFLLPIATQKQVFLLVHQLQLLKHPILSIYT